jgi:hypothetical protein
MAADIALNPVLADLEEDPKDYRWCMYAKTVSGDLQGIGGLETLYEERYVRTVDQSPIWTSGIDDYDSHPVATVAGEVVSEAALRWHETRPRRGAMATVLMRHASPQ